MVDGKSINLGGQDYVLPPCPLSGLAKLGDRLKLIGTGMSEEAIESLTDGIFFSLRRNYPEIKREFVHDNIDLLNIHAVVDAFIAVNGFQKAVEASGEQTAA